MFRNNYALCSFYNNGGMTQIIGEQITANEMTRTKIDMHIFYWNITSWGCSWY